MSWSVLSPIVLVAAALVIIALERRFPYDRQRFLREGFWVDFIGYTLVQGYVLAIVIRWLIGWIDRQTGASRYGLVSGWPPGWQLLFFVVTHDLYIYVFHRWQHRNPILWRIHEAHHSVRDVDWVAGARSHSIEILINQTIEFGAIVLLGGSPDLVLIKGVISGVWGMWIHANVDVHSGWLQRVVNGPEMHRWHHARHYVEGGRNFGTKFAFWDWLFGTAALPASKPDGYGLDAPFPRGYLAQHLYAFRSFRALSSAAPAGGGGGAR